VRTIRASEIGTYLYCQRAWGYLKSEHKPQNQAELASGTRLHEQHGRKVTFVSALRLLAYLLLLAALALFLVYLTGKVF
jgi:hypothetical protein